MKDKIDYMLKYSKYIDSYLSVKVASQAIDEEGDYSGDIRMVNTLKKLEYEDGEFGRKSIRGKIKMVILNLLPWKLYKKILHSDESYLESHKLLAILTQQVFILNKRVSELEKKIDSKDKLSTESSNE